MVADHHDDLLDTTTTPDTPYEHRVCNITLIAALLFLLSSLYYFLGPDKNVLAFNAVLITGVIFGLGLLNFFVAAFGGKLCGQKK